ncbi:conserved Plasmodium protein, unknown function [Plasmodium gallinaceum]|uniref:Uncharacterized protein n=1 Tax=Plasmodium gallinaceum TaxID=5849 RepID=A0A1J1GWZ7_PLAGA|nr:conserved Plasmodium protein, unknown function [Plasmodium gallinaceum]CRG96964.1 conserved Plasmodium protein, unknown function [Plasmodium gallinaceum]
MSYINKSLSKSINSLVLHFEFVKCKNLNDHTKKGKYYLVISFDQLMFYEKDFYEIQFKIFFYNIHQIYHCDKSNYIHITLKEDALTHDIGIKGMNKNILIKHLCIGYSTYYMFKSNKNIYVPITKETYKERCNRTNENSQIKKIDKSIQPFIGYKKVIYDDYFFFIHKSFQNATSISSGSGFYVDSRGVEISVKIGDQKSMIELDQTTDSNFYQLAKDHLNFLIQDVKIPLIIRKNFYYKKMNLSDDIAKWVGYEIYLKNETHTIVCIIFRRTFIPPLLDRRQDIIFTFRISYENQQEFNVTDKDLYDEVYIVANSITPNDIHNTYYVNLIQAQIDALLYNSEIYEYFETRIKIRPSYFEYIKMFLKSVLIILKEGDVKINSDIIDFLGDDIKVERNLEYLLNILLNQIPGINLLDTHKREKIKINRILHRLSYYLIYCLDAGLLSEKYNTTDFINGILIINKDKKKDIDDIVNFFLHLREKDFTKNYETNCLDLLKEDDKSEIQLSKKLDTNNYLINDFFLFYLHQCGYINKVFYYKNDDNYKKIISSILKCGINFKIKKKICKNLLTFSNDYKNRYFPLVNSIVSFLSYNCDKKNYCMLILSTLINITNNNNVIKDYLIKLNISKIANFLILSNDFDITHKIILLYINLSKDAHMCDDIINNGLIIHLLDILFNFYYIDLKLKKEICINILCIIGQIFNFKKHYTFILNHYIGLTEVAIYIYETTDFIYFDKIKLIYFFRQISQHSYMIKEQICKHLIPLIMKEIYLFIKKDFIYSSLNLLNVICDYKMNCLYLQKIKIFNLFNFIKSLKIIDLYKKVVLIENKVKKNLKIII